MEKFLGESGIRKLIKILRNCSLVGGHEESATLIANHGALKSYDKGEHLISQGHDDDDLFFIISGSVSICINHRKITTRRAPNHVGEMCLINPKEKRSADVIAEEKTVALCVSEPKFSELALQFPFLWKNIAIELADRLKQRERQIQTQNQIPKVLIISSEGEKGIAKKLQSVLEYDDFVVELFSDLNLIPSRGLTDSLSIKAQQSDFAVVFFPDNTDNEEEGEIREYGERLIFELGFFMGAIGPKRTFMISFQESNIQLPEFKEFIGLKVLSLRRVKGHFDSDLGKVHIELKNAIQVMGTR